MLLFFYCLPYVNTDSKRGLRLVMSSHNKSGRKSNDAQCVTLRFAISLPINVESFIVKHWALCRCWSDHTSVFDFLNSLRANWGILLDVSLLWCSVFGSFTWWHFMWPQHCFSGSAFVFTKAPCPDDLLTILGFFSSCVPIGSQLEV